MKPIGQVELGCELSAKMSPLNASQDIDRCEVEPYVYAEYVTSADHPREGGNLIRLHVLHPEGKNLGIRPLTVNGRLADQPLPDVSVYREGILDVEAAPG